MIHDNPIRTGLDKLVSINVGLPHERAWRGRTVRTAIWKEPVPGKRIVRRLNVDGDGQGDLAGHGGEQRAVLVYQIDSYRYWERELGRSAFVFGQFGENFTVDGLPDAEVCIGNRYRIGGALFEVTQPRVTCYRVGIRMDEPRMAALLVSHGRPGFYMRVLQEGEVAAGDEIIKVADGPERITVAAVNALLYLPGHGYQDLERALRIPALSPGWKMSLRALLEQRMAGDHASGNPGLAPATGPSPGWPGFRPLRISRMDEESVSVFSLLLVAADGRPLAAPLPGQFVVLRLRARPDATSILRTYSLSGAPSAEQYRISVKKEENGIGSTYLRNSSRVGDVLEVSAPRGSFTLQRGDRPVVLLGAGVGVTPLLAMLHALAAGKSTRQVWWLYAARNGSEHPFAAESRRLLKGLAVCHRHVVYSQPTSEDVLGVHFDARGHLDSETLRRLGVPRDADFYLCGPPAFLRDMTLGLGQWGVAGNRVYTEIFGPGKSVTPGIAGIEQAQPHLPGGPAGQGPSVAFARSGLTVQWDSRFQNLLDLAEACDVPVKWACRTGVCHSCESGLIGGTVDYRPDPLDQPADGNVLICCSRPRGDVIVDL